MNRKKTNFKCVLLVEKNFFFPTKTFCFIEKNPTKIVLSEKSDESFSML